MNRLPDALKTRVTFAKKALKTYGTVKGSFDEENFRDLLTDLMYYAESNSLNFDYELSQATDNYSERL